jgi:type VI protein secretion system component Hcp
MSRTTTSEQRNVAVNRDAATRILRDDELESVSGGKVKLGDIVIVRDIDKASPGLF